MDTKMTLFRASCKIFVLIDDLDCLLQYKSVFSHSKLTVVSVHFGVTAWRPVRISDLKFNRLRDFFRCGYHADEGLSKSWRKSLDYPPITYYWTVLLILGHSHLVVNLTHSKIAETEALKPLKSWHFCTSNFRTCWFPNEIRVVKD
jgi:hypothetical protein